MKNQEKKKEIVEIEVPSKAIRVKHATCPRGCNLMDTEHLINGYPSVTVYAKTGDKEGLIYLDPIYGSYKNLPEIEIKEGECADLYCPVCKISLVHEKETCSKCGAPMFAIYLPHGGVIEVCTRNGCQSHNLKFTDSEEMGKKLFDDKLYDISLRDINH